MLNVLSNHLCAISVAILLNVLVSLVISESKTSHGKIKDMDGTYSTSQFSMIDKDLIEDFIEIYSENLRDSIFYRKSNVERKIELNKQVEDLRQILEKTETRNVNESDIHRWVQQMITLPKSQLWQTMNLFFSGNHFLIKDSDNLRDEL